MSDQQLSENDEISLKELILLIQAYIKELFKYWWIIVIFVILFVSLMVYRTLNKDISYTSSMTFMMNDEKSSTMGIAGGLLNSFGFGGGENNLDKLVKLLRSRSIIKKALFNKIIIDGEEDFIANHVMRVENIEIFEDEEQTQRFFFKNSNFDRFDRLSNEALLTLHAFIAGTKNNKGILSNSIDETSGIISLELTSLSETLAVEFLIILFNVIDEYYVEKTIEKNQRTYSIIENKVDSINGLVYNKEYRLAELIDSRRKLIKTTTKLDQLRLEKDLKILIEQQIEATKLKEQAEFSLLNTTPIIQKVDFPIYPIFPNSPSLLKAIIIGGFIGGFLSVVFIVIRKIYRDAMASDE